ncbi:uncharacterized protein LOC134214883 [Armigeres subalbatus]|uniref:uncharacterized protein LOC134214883 n=1 Tax=Armigeres subalbatus TaxID=124917 RepID=UPI002ED3D453
MKQFGSHKLLIVAVIGVVMPISLAIDCKEVFQRKEELENCCTASSFITIENLKSTMDAQEGNHHEKFFCATQSLLQEQNLLNGDDINVDAMKQKTEGFDDDWKQKSLQMIDACVERIQTMTAEMEQRGGPKGQCKPNAGMFIICVGKETIKNCPADKWNSSDVCEKVKSGDCDKRGPRN